MSKTIQFKSSEVIEIDAKIPEKIEVVALMKDRIIFKPIFIKPKQKSKIIDPHTGESVEKQDELDRWPTRGEVVYGGEIIQKEVPELKPGVKFFVEDHNAVRALKINGKLYGSTRLSNVYLIYEDL
jgi:hypothetical protein